MIQLINKIENNAYIAVSGGTDSMCCLDFLRRGRDVTALHFNHNTQTSNQAQKIVEDYCKTYQIPLIIGNITRSKKDKESYEEYWRNQRYEFFDTIPHDIVMCHHLDDVVEWWIFSCLNGEGKIIPNKRPKENGYILRPFLLNKKTIFQDWNRRKNVPYYNDPSNRETIYLRNQIRWNLLPAALKVNPGIHKTIKKKVIDDYNKAKESCKLHNNI